MSVERNTRVAALWDRLTREGKHGHYETLFEVVRSEVDMAAPVAGRVGDVVFVEDPIFQKHSLYEIEAISYGAEHQETVFKVRSLSRKPTSFDDKRDWHMWVPEPLTRGRIFTRVKPQP